MSARWWDNTLKTGKVEGFETTSFDDLTKLIPGMMRDPSGVPRLPRLSGLVVPVRDLQGLIVALKIRRDDSDLKATANKALPKYLYFSASRNEREEHRNHSAPISSKPSKGSAYPRKPDGLKIHSTGATPLPPLPSCGAHLNPSLWQRRPVAARPGWEESTCKRCGKFIGYSLISKAQSKFTDRRAGSRL